MDSETKHIYKAWVDTLEDVEHAKVILAKERNLRQLLVESLYENAGTLEGTRRATVEGEDASVKITFRMNRTVNEPVLQTLREAFYNNDIPVDTVIEYKPSLNMKAYNALSDKQKHLLDEALIIKPGLPSATLVPPAPGDE